jgi:hypothetical protein
MHILYSMKGQQTGHDVHYGVASWAAKSGNPDARSVKFEWRTAAGKRARGGEVPVEALADLMTVALEGRKRGL